MSCFFWEISTSSLKNVSYRLQHDTDMKQNNAISKINIVINFQINALKEIAL